MSESRLPRSDSPLLFSLLCWFLSLPSHTHTQAHATGSAGPSSSWGHQLGRAQGWFQDVHREKIKIASTESAIGLPNLCHLCFSQLASVYRSREGWAPPPSGGRTSDSGGAGRGSETRAFPGIWAFVARPWA